MRVPPRLGDELRIGVAIAIPDPWTEPLTRARIEAGDTEALSIPPHITLLPPTAVQPDELVAVREHLAGVAKRHRPFVVELAGTDTFRPISPVVFVALVEGEERCGRLHRAVNDGPLAQQTRFPYHPHVTIAHDLEAEALDGAEVAASGFAATFPVAGFSLYEFGDDGVWRDVEEFALSS